MSREKQIEEIAGCVLGGSAEYRLEVAELVYNKGYRKQSEGEWIKDERSKFVHRYHCSVCNFFLIGEPTKYCEDCGAKMKCGAEE